MPIIKKVINPRMKLLVMTNPQTIMPNVIRREITSKTFLNLRSLVTCCVRKAEVNANAIVVPTTIVTTFPDRKPDKSVKKLRISQIK